MKETLDIGKSIVFEANIQKVWDVVATTEGINSWFMPNDFKQELGSEFTIQSPFGPTLCKVMELDPPNELTFFWGEAGWKVSFKLKDLGDKTEFTLTHTGWSEPDEIIPGPGPKQTNAEIRNRMNNGWDTIVYEGLRKVVEK
ncbi:polyketide cyclase [Anaerobacillus alkalilacustris]|uniref:Polyketide cyclase n=1 Tax=Anaerobacillus alkalilacustris TaxID=393763 RepID=A0A1S2LHQ1_9BACI|nr:SRPBCC domain-containing protein [Anaerobacillus alkalilacustris]OIJ11237.1 polyketide cyclase [Anaerobacillus alkalilacustris]